MIDKMPEISKLEIPKKEPSKSNSHVSARARSDIISSHDVEAGKSKNKPLFELLCERNLKSNTDTVWKQIYGEEETGICLGCNETTLNKKTLTNFKYTTIVRTTNDTNYTWNMIPLCLQCMENSSEEKNLIDWLGNCSIKNLKLMLILLFVRYQSLLKKCDKQNFEVIHTRTISKFARYAYNTPGTLYDEQLNLDPTELAWIYYCYGKEPKEQVFIIHNSKKIIKALDANLKELERKHKNTSSTSN